MVVFRRRLGRFKKAFLDHRKNKYISYRDIFPRFWKNRNFSGKIVTFETVSKRFKKSDTIFILGNGPSLDHLTAAQVNEISRHDSFGVSLSFLRKDLMPTYHQLALEADPNWRRPIVDAFAPYRKRYREVIFFFSTKALYRLGHPRIMPEYFPEDPQCCLYTQPDAISLDSNRAFKDADFDKSVFYRGTLSLVLYLAVHLGYKKIVLLGVDLNTRRHFYDDYPEMQDYCQKLYAFYESLGVSEKYESMHPKRDKYHPFDIYLYALNDYLKRKRGVEMLIGSKSNMLFPRLENYF